jgi:hypothetical protein
MKVAMVVNNDADAGASQELKWRYWRGLKIISEVSIGSVINWEDSGTVEEVKLATGVVMWKERWEESCCNVSEKCRVVTFAISKSRKT